MSLTVVGAVVVFYLVVLLWSSVDAVESGGWLIGPFADDAGVELITPAEVEDVEWGDLMGSIPGVVSLIAVALISLLLNISGMEFVRGDRVDVDHEVRETAKANLLLAPIAALPGFVALGDSVLVERMGARGRSTAVLSGLIMLAFGLFGTSLVGFVPRLIVGGLLVTVGVSLLVDWVRGLVRSVGVVERLLSIGIVGIIAFIGILEGIAVGVIAACAVFVVRYSRIDPVRRVGSGLQMKSRVDRTPSETTLEDEVQRRCNETDNAPEAVVFDFRQVTGIDTSGYALISQLVQHVRAVDALFVVSGLDESIQASVMASESEASADIRWLSTLDEALEFVEQTQLDQQSAVADDGSTGPSALSPELMAAFDPVTFDEGSVVMAQDSPSASMIVVRTGGLTAYRVDESGQQHRMRRFGRRCRDRRDRSDHRWDSECRSDRRHRRGRTVDHRRAVRRTTPDLARTGLRAARVHLAGAVRTCPLAQSVAG